MICGLIIDDEKKSAENLSLLIKEFCPSMDIASVAHSGKDGIEKIKQHKPDLIFLDVQMPGMSGFDMLMQLPQPLPEIIFITAHDEFAVQAFKVNAIDYLLKPVDISELKNAVQKSEERLRNKESHSGNFSIKQLLNQLSQKDKKIAVSNQEGISYIEASQVLYFVADSNYTHVHLLNGKKLTMAKTLKDVEETLSPGIFFRIHIGTIVNVSHIEKYMRGDGGSVIMSNGTSLEVAKRRKQDLLERLG